MKIYLTFMLFSLFVSAASLPKADRVVVQKSDRKLLLLKNNKVLRAYRISLGREPKGTKHREGDNKTPEGNYTLDYKKADSAYFKAIHISYPDAKDRVWAKKRGVQPGGYIMIHGQKNGFGWLGFITQYFDWTRGCIALKNKDMQEVWENVETPLPIEIRP